MNDALAHWNQLPATKAEVEILPCCGSRAWARQIVDRRPFSNEAALLSASAEIWRGLSESDWDEAFQSHPRIGASKAQQPLHPQSAAWSNQEQIRVGREDGAVKSALAEGNREYEQRFGRIFIVCATGKSGAEILEILRRRLQNDPATEMREAAEQQQQITQLRLKKWMGE
jgi:2-oxo-4-hydroxy-4-carboxy-5-ureidoimidazoline decarboxylase